MRERPEPPVIVVRHAAAPAAAVREVQAGAEEEGVPTRVETVSTGGRAASIALARSAALASPLQVGVGIDATGDVAVHHASLPPHTPALAVTAGGGPLQWRRAGAVAARIVTGLPIA
jgi:Dehydratase medium subunit